MVLLYSAVCFQKLPRTKADRSRLLTEKRLAQNKCVWVRVNAFPQEPPAPDDEWKGGCCRSAARGLADGGVSHVLKRLPVIRNRDQLWLAPAIGPSP
ncbi:hypothetical protein SKAU_G00153870 [Synaphobranchus kaupii]|uniref:Uncharacterized protein n=1 Tax=Synaphobranchus kaupii TaxID=118154 RepID=A0A9Q1IZ82_SYNKA|nr:hypothetical protein SKAU_G00153870 [Synaphobranchus kaupii]